MMKPSSLAPAFPEPLPQVGAILNLDTQLPHFTERDDLYSGNKHWKLDGSCVLIKPDRVLTIRHILEKQSPSAVFLPYEGIFPIHEQLDREPQHPGDNLALVRLKRNVEHTVPLRHRKIWSRYKQGTTVITCGYGRWPGTALENLEGLQQQYRVELGPPPISSRIYWDHYDNLDLCWSSAENGGIKAGRGNSGGPMLWWADGVHSFVGINREEKPDQQIGSWIGWERKRWLDDPLANRAAVGSGGDVRLRSPYPVIVEAKGGVILRLPVPRGAVRIKATLNASDGLRLQMGMELDFSSGDLLEKLKEDNRASGRFLFRNYTLRDETEVIAVGIAPVASAPVRADRVFAQLCVLFY